MNKKNKYIEYLKRKSYHKVILANKTEIHYDKNGLELFTKNKNGFVKINKGK